MRSGVFFKSATTFLRNLRVRTFQQVRISSYCSVFKMPTVCPINQIKQLIYYIINLPACQEVSKKFFLLIFSTTSVPISTFSSAQKHRDKISRNPFQNRPFRPTALLLYHLFFKMSSKIFSGLFKQICKICTKTKDGEHTPRPYVVMISAVLSSSLQTPPAK